MRKKILSLVLLLLAGITAAHAYDFSAVAPTGQTLYYTVLDPVTHTVWVTRPNNTAISTSWSGYTKPTGSLTIPSSVTYGGTTYSVTSIGYDAFYDCTGLTSVSIPNSVTSIYDGAFYGCSGLTSLTIPNSVTFIGSAAFCYCSGLASVNIPNSVTSIYDYAFQNCTGLTSISIPNSVTSIGNYAFYNCNGLASVNIPNSVTSIGNYAFQNCTGLTSISIPSSVTSIGNHAFYNCNGLTSITVKRASPPSIANYTFNAPTNIPVYIPCGSTATYSSTSNWSRFRIFIEESDVHISVSSSNTTMGTARVVTQPSCTSSTATVSATPRSGYTFLNWTVGNTVVSTSQTYSFTATASRTLKANFAYAGNCDITNSNLPYSNNFDSYTTSTTAKTGVQPPCWTLAHQDVSMTDAYKPMIYYDNSIAHSGNYSLILNKRCIYAMPYVTMDVNRLKLTFYLRQTQTKYQLQVGVMSDLSDESTFVPVATLDNSSTTSSVFQTVNFETYTGLGHYIAFRNTLAAGNTGDYSCNYIDDLTLSVNTTACTLQVSSLPYTDNFNSYTTSTTAKTGVEPPCWTLAHQDVTMTDEYKPMIYYSSANAHSGNYSLILNKRGIYAMPYINGSVSNLQLSMYVKQPQTKYQMQVGIMSDLNNASTFTPIATINNSGTGYVLHTISFSSYTGSGRYIAFRNILASGQTGDYSLNYIDDLTLSNTSTYTITATANPTAGGTVTGGGTYNSGATCTLRATAALGYAFTNWTSGSTVVSTNATYSFTVSANRTLKANFVRRYTITASANPSTGGTVTGGGTYNNGATCTLRATPNANYTFTNWTTGSTVLSTNPTYSFTVSANKTIKANFAYTANCGIDNSDLPYTDNFDSYTTSTTAKTSYTLPCWTLAHQDVTITDEYKPMVYYGNSYSGNYSLILNKRCIYAMPRVAMDVNLLKLQFYVKQTAAKYQLQVGVMTDLNDASTFTPVATINNSSTTESVLRTVTFSNYTGLGHYIAFRNILASGNTGDYSLNYIDNLTLSVNTSACSLYVSNLPFSDNFDSYTTSTTAKTGVEPPCWNLAHQDVTMTDEYKPMVYYSSANAHSGNYSLILNKRGIYTMPYIDGSIRNLQLSMYVKQTQTKYQLQVGVMSDLNDASSFTPIATINNSGTGYVLHTVSFSSYTGSGRYIAFRNTLASGNTGEFSINYIDDLTLSNAATYTITATANPTAGGSVSGAGTYTSGSTCTLRATPASGYTFTNWTSGSTVVSTNATYSFTVTANRTLKANFTYTPNCQIQPSSLPYFDNFNSYTSSTTAKTGVEPACWTLAYQDVTMTDEYKPMIYYSSANAHSGNYSLILNKRGIYAMPQYTGDVSTLQVSFYLKQTKSTYGLTVGVMSDLSNPSTFVPVTTLYNSSTTAIEHYVVDFSSYTGNGHYIAFRNINSAVSDFSCNFIDDLTLSLSSSSCAIHAADMPYSDNFDSYTTSTTAKTGVEPTCWTLVHQDVAMSDEYKPMIYYSSANAHSGNYSLILNKRGIYAMPTVDCDVSTLQISMYVKQSMTKYQLQVGVMTNLSDASTFVPVTTIDNGSTASEHVTVSFARYTGNGRYIAFRNVLASGYSGEYSCNYIDDLTLSVRCAIHNSELPWIEGFENHTTSTTAKTGVEPACWTLVHQDVSMTTEYKPMVYYESSCAHSGNYSLILNKRCLYALPTVIANVNTLQMELYVRQTQTKYQLQVGVLSNISDYTTFVPIATLDNGSNTTTSQRHVVNFSSYTGNGHYIAFRNILAPGNSGDYSCNYIDDITLRQPSAAYLEDDKSGSTHLDTPSQHRLTLYPNPTSDKLTVEADEEVVRVDVFDYTGRCVASFERQSTIDLGRLATGLYTLRITLPERIEVRRVVKQ
ncbi:MAG: leucine-rich repeat domain-containing protein [Bacteroidales bacterium]|nr:leucine-rich repeat domain-containing protein [Bacteroidales bacterium]